MEKESLPGNSYSGGGLYGGIANNGVNVFGGTSTYYSGGGLYKSSPVNFYSNFQNNTNSGYADTFVTPLPTAAMMALASPPLLLLLCFCGEGNLADPT
jgi:hypothetical protein